MFAASEINLSNLVIKSIDERTKKRTEELGIKGRVHASSVMYCLLRQYYSMTLSEDSVTNPNSDSEKYKLHQGDISEAALANLMQRDGYKLIDGLKTVDYKGIDCTPDRILALDIGSVEIPLSPVEYKNVDTYSFMKMCLEGLEKSNITYFVQCLLYAASLGFSGTKFFAAAKSPAAVSTDINRKLKTLNKKPGIQSVKEKEKLLGINGWSYEEWIPLNEETQRHIDTAVERANLLYTAQRVNIRPAREYTPGKDWQCDYCPFRIRCEIEG